MPIRPRNLKKSRIQYNVSYHADILLLYIYYYVREIDSPQVLKYYRVPYANKPELIITKRKVRAKLFMSPV